MKQITKALSTATLVTIGLLLCIYGASAIGVIPKGQKPSTKGTIASEKQQVGSEYKRQLSKYLANIDGVNAAAEKASMESFKKLMDDFNQRHQKLASNEQAVLDELRAESQRRRSKKLDFEGMRPENLYVISTSAASARVFTTLYREGLVEAKPMMSMLSNQSRFLLCNEWAPLIEEIRNSVEKDSPLWRGYTNTLYAMGVSRNEYRRVIEGWITELRLNVPSSLELLIFEFDKNDGRRRVMKTSENSVVARKVLEMKDRPEMRVIAAEYFTETGEIKLAEDTLIEILWQPYKGIGIKEDDRSSDVREHDSRLYFARHRAMPFMLHKLKSERVFKEICDRANMDWTDGQEKQKLPAEWRGVSRYNTGGLEIDEAKALVNSVGGDID